MTNNPMQHAGKFKLGDRVSKIKGSQWTGRVVGFYSTPLTPEGYAVESETETGSVQIYPAAALASAPPSATVGVDVPQLAEQARAWELVFCTLEEVSPGWRDGKEPAMYQAAKAIRALAQQPAAPSGEAVAILHPQPRKLGAYGSYYDPPRTHRAFTYTHQPDNLLASRLGDAFRKAAAGSAGDGIDRGLVLLLALQEAGFGVFQVEPSSAAPQQPAAVDEDAAEALRFLLTRIGSWTNARWDQHLRHEFGDDRAGRMITALAAQQQGGRADG